MKFCLPLPTSRTAPAGRPDSSLDECGVAFEPEDVGKQVELQTNAARGAFTDNYSSPNTHRSPLTDAKTEHQPGMNPLSGSLSSAVWSTRVRL